MVIGMTEKEMLALKKRLFGDRSKRTGIPVEYYELPQEEIAHYEAQKRQEQAQKARKKRYRDSQVFSIPHLGKKAPRVDQFDSFGELE